MLLAWAGASLPWITGRSYIPWDSLSEFYPQSHFVVSSLLRGEAPWWNPYLFAGTPVLGDPQSLIFTPHTLVGVLAGRGFNLHVFDVTTLACMLCGGLALWRYGQGRSRTWLPPILGAVVFMLGGVATSRMQHVPQVISYGYLPVLLLLHRHLCARPTPVRGALLAAALLAAILNPNQVVFLSAPMLAPFFLLHLRRAAQPGRALAFTAAACLAAALAALPVLSAIQELLQVSNRPSLGLQDSAPYSFPFLTFASLVLPGLFGALTPAQGFWAPTDITQDYLYVGVVPAAIALLSLLVPKEERSPEILLCQVMLVVSALFALGLNGPLYPFLFQHVPGFTAFRRPADGAYFLNLFVALLVAVSPAPVRIGWRAAPGRLLAACGTVALLAFALASLHAHAARVGHLADLAHNVRSFGLRLGVLCAVLAVLGWMGRARAMLSGCFLIAFTVADLSFAGRLVTFAPATADTAVATLYSRPDLVRSSQAPLAETIRFLSDSLRLRGAGGYRIEALGGDLGANAAMVFGIASTQGYDPIKLAHYADRFGAQNLQVEAKRFSAGAPDYASPAYRQLGLRFLLVDRVTIDHPDIFGAVSQQSALLRAQLAAAGWASLVPSRGAYEIWELPDAHPKAELVGTAPIPQASAACEVAAYRNTSMSLRCVSPEAARLIIHDAFAPGWIACVNGAAAPVSVEEGVFRAVPVPAGESRISLRYQPVPMLRGRSCDAG